VQSCGNGHADGLEASALALRNGVMELGAAIDEFMLAMYASEMLNLLFTKGRFREASRANAWFLALEHAVFLSFERRGELQ